MLIFKNRLLSGVAFTPYLGIDGEGDDAAGGGGGDDTNLQLDDQDDTPGDDQGDDQGDDGDDQGDDGDDQGDDDQGDDAGDGEAGRGGRAGRSIAALRADRARLAEENARITRQLDELRRAPQQPPAAVETPAQRAERLALLPSDERAQVMVDEALARHQQQNNALMGQLMDQSDRTAFEAQCERNPLARKLAGEVERRLTALRQTGQNLPRQVILTYVLGERLLQQNGKGKPGRQLRRERERVPARNPQGDVRPSRADRRSTGDPAADFERRHGDALI